MPWLSSCPSCLWVLKALLGRVATSQMEFAPAETQPHCVAWAGPGSVSHTAFSMWMPEQITFPIMNNQTRSSVVTESNCELTWSNQTWTPPGLTPVPLYKSSHTAPWQPTEWESLQRIMWSVCPLSHRLGRRLGHGTSGFTSGSDDTRNMDTCSALSTGCSRFRNQYRVCHVLFFPKPNSEVSVLMWYGHPVISSPNSHIPLPMTSSAQNPVM